MIPLLTLADGHPSPRTTSRQTCLWIVLLALLCLVPLFVTPVLPLIDFYAHVVRYTVLAHVASDPALAESYAANWRPLPNLGLDVLGTGVMALLPPLPGAKLIAALVILAPVLGALALAGSLQPIGPANIALAGLLGFSMILAWGFANFLLGLGLALGTLGFWIAARRRPWLQFSVTAGLALVIMLVHGLVFALWGLLLFSVEIMLILDSKRRPSAAQVLWRLIRLGGLAVGPVLLFLKTQTATAMGGVTKSFSNLAAHAEQGALLSRLMQEAGERLDSFLRVAESSWPWPDRAFGALLWLALAWGYASGALHLDRRLWLATGLAALLVAMMPPNLFDVGHLDERMPLVLLAVLAAGTRLQDGTALARRLPAFFCGLFVLHLAMVTIGWAREGQSYRAYRESLATLDPGGLGEAVFLGKTSNRDLGRACKPLLFLMLLDKWTAVTTFANPTQQPLILQGPLVAARDRAFSLLPDAGPGPESRSAKIERQIAAGFDTVVTCDDGPPLPDLATARLVAADGAWALYERRSSP
jgi:hypothetical protein